MHNEPLENIEFGKANLRGTTPKESWRTSKPVVDQAACVDCGRCVAYCPEGCMDETDGRIVVDLRFCKGCAICETECPVEAITMEEE